MGKRWTLVSNLICWTVLFFVLCPRASGSVCKTKSCADEAALIKSSMDESVNPCDDFYQFACGGFQKKANLPEWVSSLNKFDEIQTNLNRRLHGLMSEPVQETDENHVRMAKMYYNRCLDEKTLAEEDPGALLDTLTRLGGWPLLVGKNWTPKNSSHDWIDLTLALKAAGVFSAAFMHIEVTPDFQNTSNIVVGLSEGLLGSPESSGKSLLPSGQKRKLLDDDKVYYADDYTNRYYKLIKEVTIMLGAQEGDGQLDRDVTAIVDLEVELANFVMPDEEKADPGSAYRRVTLDHLRGFVRDVNWNKLLFRSFGRRLADDQIIIYMSEKWLLNIADVLKAQPQRVIYNYVLWKVVRWALPRMSEKHWELVSDFNNHYSANAKMARSPRWKSCLSMLEPELGDAVSNLYIRKYFSQAAKDDTVEMAAAMHDSFVDMLRVVDWMEESSRTEAIKKAEEMMVMVGYPGPLANVTVLRDHYKDLKIRQNMAFFDIQRLLFRWKEEDDMKMLGKVNDREDWKPYGKIAQVNAFYKILENAIVFPAGVLQDVVYSLDKPPSLNFGSMGFVMGHEMTHGFDDIGRGFDSQGNNRNWWSEKTIEMYNVRANCILGQYNNYSQAIDGRSYPLNGDHTLSDNIADSGGLKLAYKAYKTYQRLRKEASEDEMSLPGLRYSPSQLFWIGFAQVWCSLEKGGVKYAILSDGDHAPNEFRVKGPAHNSPNFGPDWNCPIGSPMNPENKCQHFKNLPSKELMMMMSPQLAPLAIVTLILVMATRPSEAQLRLPFVGPDGAAIGVGGAILFTIVTVLAIVLMLVLALGPLALCCWCCVKVCGPAPQTVVVTGQGGGNVV